jgi:hypothetical protein
VQPERGFGVDWQLVVFGMQPIDVDCIAPATALRLRIVSGPRESGFLSCFFMHARRRNARAGARARDAAHLPRRALDHVDRRAACAVHGPMWVS